MMTEMDADHPRAYEHLLGLETTASVKAYQRSLGTSPQDMPGMVDGLIHSVQQSLEADPPVNLPMSRIERHVHRLTAYLVGECALDWRPQDAS